jgi:SAM-dependent methyltransferase
VNSSAGYVADLDYTAGFYRETAPSHLAFAALVSGAAPGCALAPARVLDLGFGRGFGLALLAAANPDTAFEGCDASESHVAHARRLVDAAGLANVILTQATFEETAAREAERNVDVIVMHGILSWVSRTTQDAALAVMRERLRAGGLAYVSYNCLPGWAPLAPLRQLMLDIKRFQDDGSEQQLARALFFLNKLKEHNAPYFLANPVAAGHLDDMLGMDPRYLAHEYLGEHWAPLAFSQAAARLGEAGLSYVASATLPENFDRYSVPPKIRPLLPVRKERVLDESLRDFAGNKYFRRDILARDPAPIAAGERRRAISDFRFILAVPRRRVVFRFFAPLGEFGGNDELYAPIADALAAKPMGFEEMLALPQFGEKRIDQLLECVMLLVHSGQVLPVPPAGRPDAAPAQRFNRLVAEEARTGRVYNNLACAVARTGIPVTDFGLLALAAFFDGKAADAKRAARYGLAILKDLERRPLRNKIPIDDDADAVAFLTEHMTPVFEELIPLWQRLEML